MINIDNPVIIRLNSDGTIDTTYGVNGQTAAPFDLTQQGRLNYLGTTVDSNGNSYSYVEQEFIKGIQIAKINQNGVVDNTFGIVNINHPSGYDPTLDIVNPEVIKLNSGKLLITYLLADYTNSLFNRYIVKFNTDGTIDTSFADNGYYAFFTNDVSLYFDVDYIYNLKEVNNGKIYFYTHNTDHSVKLTRFNANGTIDTTFCNNGELEVLAANIDPHPMIYERVEEMDNGSVLLTSTTMNVNGVYATVQIELRDSAGALDPLFADAGVLTLDTPILYRYVNQTKLLQSGKILILEERVRLNSSSTITRLLRINQDGSIDTSFGTNGYFVFPFYANFVAITKIDIDTNNKILIYGNHNGNYTGFSANINTGLIIRLNSNGTLDTTFGRLSPVASNNFKEIEIGANIVLFPEINVNDLELSNLNAGAGNFNGAYFTLQNAAAASPDDEFTFINSVTTEGNIVKVSGVPVATFTNSLGTLIVTFNSNNATTAIVNTVLRNISYKYNGAIDPDVISWFIDLTFNDGNTGAQGIGGPSEFVTQVKICYEYGVVLSTYCVIDIYSSTGTEKWSDISLGNGDSMSILLNAYSVDCGFDPLLISDPFTETVKTNLYDHVNPVGSPWRQGDWGFNTTNPDTLKLEISSPGYVTVLEYVDGDIEGTDVPFASIQNAKCVAWVEQSIPVYNYSIEANVEILSDANDSYVSLIGRIQNGPGSNTGDYVDVNWWPSPSWAPGTSSINESNWGSGILSQDVTSLNETFTGIHLFRVDFINNECKVYIDNILKSTIIIDTTLILPNVGGFVGLGITAKTTNLDGPGIRVLDFKVTALF